MLKAIRAQNADVTTYRVATGFEALMGYLHLTKQTERMEELIRWCIQKVGEKMGKERTNKHQSKRGFEDKNKIDIQIKSKLDEISQFLIKMKKH